MYKDSLCCFVGASDQMNGSKKGQLIDSFDTVCRSLGSSGKILQNHEDLGSRTDVLFINPKVCQIHKTFDVNHFKENGVRSIVFRNRIPNGCDYLVDNGIEISSCADITLYRLGTVPMMAVLATQWLLNRGSEFVYISGCDFYSSYRKNNMVNLSSWLSGYQAEWDNEPPSNKHDYECHYQWFWRKLVSCKVFCDDIFAEEINNWWKEKTRKRTEIK